MKNSGKMWLAAALIFGGAFIMRAAWVYVEKDFFKPLVILGGVIVLAGLGVFYKYFRE